MAEVLSPHLVGMEPVDFTGQTLHGLPSLSQEHSNASSRASSIHAPSGPKAFSQPGGSSADRPQSHGEPVSESVFDSPSPSGFAEAMKRRTSAEASGSTRSHSRRAPAQLTDLSRPELQRQESSNTSAHPNLQQWGSAPLTRTQFQGHTPRVSLSATGISHRRKGSELIGNSSENGEMRSSSQSPTKHLAPSPSASPSASRPRRGHAHRRSAAISASDVSSALSNPPPPMPEAGSSAIPPSPSQPYTPRRDSQTSSLHKRSRSIIQPSNPESMMSPDAAAKRATSFDSGSPSGSQLPTRRVRVGFAAQVQYIPRPLSTISSDNGSVRTFVTRHSANNSISSLSHSDPSSPTPNALISLPETGNNAVEGLVEGRVLDQIQLVPIPSARRTRSFGELLHRPRKLLASISLPSPTQEPTSTEPIPRRRFFGRFSPILDSESTNKTSYFSDTAIDDSSNDESPDPVSSSSEVTKHPLQQAEDRLGKRRSKTTRRWGHSHPIAQTRGLPDPTSTRTDRTALEETQKENQMADEPVLQASDDTTMTAVDPEPSRSPVLITTGLVAAQSPPRARQYPAQESTSPVIDLDAALGPFNTPELGPGFKDPKNGGFAVKARRMHSGGEREQHNSSGPHLAGPSMSRWHKRTVSAPTSSSHDGFDWEGFNYHENVGPGSMPDVAEEAEDSHEEALDAGSPAPGGERLKTEEEMQQTTDPVFDDVADSPQGLPSPKGIVSEGLVDEPFLSGPGDEESDLGSESFLGGPGDDANEGEPFIGGPGDEVMVEESGFDMESLGAGPGDEVVEPLSDQFNDLAARPASDDRASNSTISTLRPDLVPPPNVKQDHELRRSQLPYLVPPTPTSAASSAIPSPDFVQPSFDEPRLLTAGSSFTDEYPYEPTRQSEAATNDTRCSVSDVPSLIGSVSPHTSAVNVATLNQLTRPSAMRSFSDNRADVRQSRPTIANHKRASLLSLTRLMHASPSKSKLSLETSALEEDEPAKQAKRRRFSRLLQFWKGRSVD